MSYESKNLGNWAIGEGAFEWIYNNIKHGSTILELGSGTGTIELCKYYNVYSVEQEARWLNLAHDQYIFAPLKSYDNMAPHSSGWYNDSMFEKLPTNYDFLLIDGPVGNNRANFMLFHEKFNFDIPVLLDDTQRGEVVKMANDLSKIYNKTIVTPPQGSNKNFVILT